MTAVAKTILFLASIFLLGVLVSSRVFAVLPPEFYERQVQSSAIKAIAVVEEVNILDETAQSSYKKVFFSLERPFSKDIPKNFTGYCYSVDHKWQTPSMGGTIHYYPRKGERALVTVSSDNGSITSYTQLSPELEKELNKNSFKNISFQRGRASIKNVMKYLIQGRIYLKEKSYKKAFKEFNLAAQLGHSGAQKELGSMYYHGNGVEQDYIKARQWYEASAIQNNIFGRLRFALSTVENFDAQPAKPIPVPTLIPILNKRRLSI